MKRFAKGFLILPGQDFGLKFAIQALLPNLDRILIFTRYHIHESVGSMKKAE